MAASPTGLALDAAGAVAADGVGGQLGDELSLEAVVGQGNSHVGLTAAEGGLEGGSLNETLVVEGLQTQHQLAESDNLCHDQNLYCYKFFSIMRYQNRIPSYIL